VAYKVIFEESAEKEFDALSQGQKKALFEKLKILAADPAPAETVELKGYAPLRRIKAGNARAIYDEPDAKGRIFILRVGSDHDIYDNLNDLLDDEPEQGQR
jgi:mRNA-degrading endonuclease RelE of RelBE toxin-antitoxin system